jgi:hypothetical protein
MLTQAAACTLALAARTLGPTAPLGVIARQNAEALRCFDRQDADRV